MAQMNLAIHGIANNGLGSGPGDTFARDLHAGVQMDYVLANPPFNIKDWTRNTEDDRWRFGVPPADNANYAWIQHILSKLAPGGKAGIVMANGSMSSNSNGEGEIRAEIVEADLVSCMVALPTQLFRSTGIPVCLWFFAKGKGAGKQGSVDRTGQVLFIDARELGYMVDRAERALVRRGDRAHRRHLPRLARVTLGCREGRDVRGRAGLLQVGDAGRDQGGGLRADAGRYVGAAEVEDDGEPFDAKIERLTKELLAAFDESARLEKVVREQLERIGE